MLDVQNVFVAALEEEGRDAVLSSVSRFVRAVRRAGIPIIHVIAVAREDNRNVPRHNRMWNDPMWRDTKLGTFVAEWHGAQIHPVVEARESELVLVKNSIDPFLTTGLHQALNNGDIHTVMMFRFWANFAVEGTARHAADIGYRTIVVSDCCASGTQADHDFAVTRILPRLCDVAPSQAVLSALGIDA
jgi:nicotinamidase-related amidase